MTTPLTTTPQFDTSATVSAEGGEAEAGPYAQPASPMRRYPVDAVLIDAIRATIGPFVPEPWRTTPGEPRRTPTSLMAVPQAPRTFDDPASRLEDDTPSDTPSVELPWIDAYLGDTAVDADLGAGDDVAEQGAAEPVTAELFVPPAASAAQTAEPTDRVAAEQAAVEPFSAELASAEPVTAEVSEPVEDRVVAESSPSEVTSAAADAWPMDEAGAALRALAGEIPARENGAAPPADVPRAVTPLYVPPVAATPPLPMWGDDDLMDIMPVKASAAGTVEPWAERARRESERAGNPDAAATALEALAQRVRRGELEMPSYSPDMSDAAMLAGALAALLGVRR